MDKVRYSNGFRLFSMAVWIMLKITALDLAPACDTENRKFFLLSGLLRSIQK